MVILEPDIKHHVVDQRFVALNQRSHGHVLQAALRSFGGQFSGCVSIASAQASSMEHHGGVGAVAVSDVIFRIHALQMVY